MEDWPDLFLYFNVCRQMAIHPFRGSYRNRNTLSIGTPCKTGIPRNGLEQRISHELIDPNQTVVSQELSQLIFVKITLCYPVIDQYGSHRIAEILYLAAIRH